MSHNYIFFTDETKGRPSQQVGKKDEQYHIDYGRYTASSGLNHPQYQAFVRKTIRNYRFSKGDQWFYYEDGELFFMDETGHENTRIKLTKNIIKPIVKQYQGNAIRMSYNVQVANLSESVINRREQELNQFKLRSALAGRSRFFGPQIEKNFQVAQDEGDAEKIFQNQFVDEEKNTLTNLIKALEPRIDIDFIKEDLAKREAVAGISIIKDIEENGEFSGEIVDEAYHWFDRGAMRKDLKDAAYQGHWWMSDPTLVYERHQPGRATVRMIEDHMVKKSKGFHTLAGYDLRYYDKDRLPVFASYWKDSDFEEYGWVTDPYGYPLFTMVNGENSNFTTKDLIAVPDRASEKLKDLLKRDRSVKISTDVCRYCIFIPHEEFGRAGDDIILESGKLPYRNTDRYATNNSLLPFHVAIYDYDNGEIIAPIDDVIDPQRMINRFESVMENRVSQSGGKGPAIASESLDPAIMDERDVTERTKRGEVILLKSAAVGGVQNAMTTYDHTTDDAANNIALLSQGVQKGIQDNTGITESLLGTEAGANQLVGVTESIISRGTLLQEPFYAALIRQLNSFYTAMAEVAPRIYYNNPRKLAIYTGDKGVQQIDITKDFLLSDFRLHLERVEEKNVLIQQAKLELMQLLQLGLIDQERFANLYGRSTPDDIPGAIRDRAIELIQAQREAQRRESQETNAAAQANQQAFDQQLNLKLRDDEREDINKDLDRTRDETVATIGAQAKVASSQPAQQATLQSQ